MVNQKEPKPPVAFSTEHPTQKVMIEMLQRDDVHAMGLFGFTKLREGIEPIFIIADNMPNREVFYKELYALCDRYLDFRKVYETQILPGREGGES